MECVVNRKKRGKDLRDAMREPGGDGDDGAEQETGQETTSEEA